MRVTLIKCVFTIENKTNDIVYTQKYNHIIFWMLLISAINPCNIFLKDYKFILNQ